MYPMTTTSETGAFTSYRDTAKSRPVSTLAETAQSRRFRTMIQIVRRVVEERMLRMSIERSILVVVKCRNRGRRIPR